MYNKPSPFYIFSHVDDIDFSVQLHDSLMLYLDICHWMGGGSGPNTVHSSGYGGKVRRHYDIDILHMIDLCRSSPFYIFSRVYGINFSLQLHDNLMLYHDICHWTGGGSGLDTVHSSEYGGRRHMLT